MNNLLIICVAIVVIAYIYSYYLHPGNIRVFQTSVAHFDGAALLEKQPVVIQDGLPNLANWRFKYAIPQSNITPDVWNKNKYKHLVIHSGGAEAESESHEVLVCPATAKRDVDGAPVNDSAIIAFKMSPGQTVVLPFHWSYYLPAPAAAAMTITGIHDMITYFLP
jgi:hypothetical protein